VGGSVSAPDVLGTVMKHGKACITYTYDCQPSVTSTEELWYIREVYWEPSSIPDTFTTPGTYTFTAKVRGAYWEGGGWVCPEYTDPATVGTFTVHVVGVGSLQSDQGSNPDGLTNIVDWADSGVVTVTATPNPNIPPNDLPSCWNMWGGTEVSRTVHTVPKSAPGFYTIIASAGTSAKTQVVVVVKCQFWAYAREGTGCCSLSGDMGHGWWKLSLEPSGAKVLVGGDPIYGPQAFVNRELGWGCRDCVANGVCMDTGYPMLDGDNTAYGPFTDSHHWLVTFLQLKSAAIFSAAQEGPSGPTYYYCGVGGSAYNCVTVARSAGEPAGVVIPSFSPAWPWCAYDCPHEFAYWLASLL
jgi:hypothetical protein